MEQRGYGISASSDRKVYGFISTGRVGRIQKIVRFTKFDFSLEYQSVYNCSLLDVKEGTVTDQTVSDNGDIVIVIATVVTCIESFLRRYSTSFVFIKGSDESRTNLYKRVLSNYFDAFSHNFVIYGVVVPNHKDISPVIVALKKEDIEAYQVFLIGVRV